MATKRTKGTGFSTAGNSPATFGQQGALPAGWSTINMGASSDDPSKQGRDYDTQAVGQLTSGRISDRGLQEVMRHEGVRLTAYPDPGSRDGTPWTIGYGHTKGVTPGMTITQKQAEQFLREDIRTAEQAVARAVKVPLTQNQFDALVSFTYNVGGGALQSSTLLKKLNAGDYNAIPNELAKWSYNDGKRMQGLANRREAEARLWAGGPLPPMNIPSVATQTSSASEGVKAYQQQLKAAGFDPGAIDGIAGANTKAAVRAFQQAHGLAVDGIVGPQTLAALNRLNTVSAGSADPSKRGTTVASGATATYSPVTVRVGGVEVAVRPTAQSVKNAVAPTPAGHDQMFAARSGNLANVNPGMVAPVPAGHDQMLAARNPVPQHVKTLGGFSALLGVVTAGQQALQGVNTFFGAGSEEEGFGEYGSGPLNRGRPSFGLSSGPIGPLNRGRPSYQSVPAPIPVFGRPQQQAPIPATRSSMIAPVPRPADERPTGSSPTASANRPIGETRIGANGYVYTNTESGWKQTGTVRPPSMTPSQQYAVANTPARQPATTSKNPSVRGASSGGGGETPYVDSSGNPSWTSAW